MHQAAGRPLPAAPDMGDQQASAPPASCRRSGRPGRWCAAGASGASAGLRWTGPAAPIVELVRQLEALVAAVGCDVGGLAVQIDRVFGVDLELLGDLRRRTRRTAARSARRPAMPRSGYDSSSNAVRRWPSWLSARPCFAASVGVSDSEFASALAASSAAIFGVELPLPRRADAADRDALAGQPLIGVVGPQRQPIFGPRGEHPIRLGDAAGHQIVDHHAEIAFGAVEHDRPARRRPAPRR